MAESTASLVQRLVLSAHDLKILTGGQKAGDPWPDALVEDYLNILRDLITLADLIDSNAGQFVENVEKLLQVQQVNSVLINKLQGITRKNSNKSKDLEQLTYAW
jgi:hypothetical protein